MRVQIQGKSLSCVCSEHVTIHRIHFLLPLLLHSVGPGVRATRQDDGQLHRHVKKKTNQAFCTCTISYDQFKVSNCFKLYVPGVWGGETRQDLPLGGPRPGINRGHSANHLLTINISIFMGRKKKKRKCALCVEWHCSDSCHTTLKHIYPLLAVPTVYTY